MRKAIITIMLLSLWRDKGALAMGFILPGLVYIIFASIFAGAAGGDVKIRLALLDERQEKESIALAHAIEQNPAVIVVRGAETADEIRKLVQTGSADVAAIIRDNGTGFAQLMTDLEPPVLIIYDPFREISVKLLQGIVQESYFSAIPSATVEMVAGIIEEAFFEFEPQQKIALQEGLLVMDEAGEGLSLGSVFELAAAGAESSTPAGVSYYAGAVAMLFLLFSALNGSISILEERENGLFDRVTMGRGGTLAYMQGKFIFLCGQGICEVAVIFLVAWLMFGVDVPGHFLPWLVISVAATCCAAGLGLFFVSCCRSRLQAQSLGNILVLVISALAGSMEPRFLMPPAIQELGWLTPNTWLLEAYSEVFWRQADQSLLVLPVCLLIGSGLIGTALAIALQLKRRG